jgi:hypothetical protein
MYKCVFEKYVYATKEEPPQKSRDFFSKKTWRAIFSDVDGVYEAAELESQKNGISPSALLFTTAELPFVPMVDLKIWLTHIKAFSPILIKKISYSQESNSFTCVVDEERPYISIGGELIDINKIVEMRLEEGWGTHPNTLSSIEKLKAA